MLIQFGELQIKLLIPILFPIFLKLRRLNRRRNHIDSAAFKGFNDFLSMALCGIFYLILFLNTKSNKYKNKKIEKETEKSEKKSVNGSLNSSNDYQKDSTSIKSQIQKKNLKMEKLQKKRKFYFIMLISLLQIIAIIIKNLWKDKIEEFLKLNIAVLMEIIFFIYFSMKFLDLIIYSHQIFSMIGISICLIIFFIESLAYNRKKIEFGNVILSIIYYFAVAFFYCLSDVLGKKYLNSFIENVYSFIFKMGIIGLIPICIYGFIVIFINIDEKYTIFQHFSKISFGIYILDLFFSCLFEIGIWLTIYYFTPCHYIIFEAIADFLEIILNKFDKENKSKYTTGQHITFFILYPIIIFIVFVFNEIIILNFCNLNYNTKVKIMEREKIDSLVDRMHDMRLMSNEIEDEKGEGVYIIN